MQALFGALRHNQDATNAFLSAITGAIPLHDFMSDENLGRIMAARDVELTRERRFERSAAMYVIREVLHCKPGKVRQMVEKFRAISNALEGNGATNRFACSRMSLVSPSGRLSRRRRLSGSMTSSRLSRSSTANETLRNSHGRLSRPRGERPARNVSNRELRGRNHILRKQTSS